MKTTEPLWENSPYSRASMSFIDIFLIITLLLNMIAAIFLCRDVHAALGWGFATILGIMDSKS